MEPVDADVDFRVGPVDELAVHPDLVGLLHRVSSPLSLQANLQANRSSSTTSTGVRAPGARARPARGRPRAAAIPRRPRRSGAGEACAPAGPCRRAGAGTARRPRREPGGLLDLVRRRDPRGVALRAGARDLLRIAPAVARHEREHRRSVAHEDERLHDLSRARSPRRPRPRLRSASLARTPRSGPRRRPREGRRRPAARAPARPLPRRQIYPRGSSGQPSSR